jgi:hypothetical protein
VCEIVDDGERCDVWSEVQRQARKDHVCSCCQRTIKAGERYMVHFSVYDGNPCQEKLCTGCEADREKFGKAHGGFTCTPSDFPYRLSECISEGDAESKTIWRPMLEAIQARAGGDGG